MARIIKTHETLPTDLKTQWERDQVYNGKDCCITLEIYELINEQLDNQTRATYEFSKDLQGPVLEMRLRGVKIDQRRRAEMIDVLYDQIDQLEANLDRIVLDGVGLPTFSWTSNADLQTLFYNRLRIPPIKKGGRPTVNRDALEKMEQYLVARPIVRHIQAMRDAKKKIDFLRTGIDPDGRMRTSYNIAGTDTGRFSSSYSEFGTGGNLQNVEEGLRSVFISDTGMKMAKFDAKSGESFCVGGREWILFKDGRYLDACESGDIHTSTARVCWPNLGWTGNLEQDKALAETPYYRHYTYRFMCKKLGHGSNYDGQAPTLSTQAKLPISVVWDFQPKYFAAFPAKKRWHAWVDAELRRSGTLTTLTGRRRQFWGRRSDPATLRQAIAYDPQGSLADIVNAGMLRVWDWGAVQVLMQDHDAITIQYPEEMEDEVIPHVLKLLANRTELAHGREMSIPYDAQVGWNKGKYDPKKNPDGLRDWVPGDGGRRRTPDVHILDRVG